MRGEESCAFLGRPSHWWVQSRDTRRWPSGTKQSGMHGSRCHVRTREHAEKVPRVRRRQGLGNEGESWGDDDKGGSRRFSPQSRSAKSRRSWSRAQSLRCGLDGEHGHRRCPRPSAYASSRRPVHAVPLVDAQPGSNAIRESRAHPSSTLGCGLLRGSP
jgi:hypothetical protein